MYILFAYKPEQDKIPKCSSTISPKGVDDLYSLLSWMYSQTVCYWQAQSAAQTAPILSPWVGLKSAAVGACLLLDLLQVYPKICCCTSLRMSPFSCSNQARQSPANRCLTSTVYCSNDAPKLSDECMNELASGAPYKDPSLPQIPPTDWQPLFLT